MGIVSGSPWGTILTLTPALTMTQDAVDRALDILDSCLGEVDAA